MCPHDYQVLHIGRNIKVMMLCIKLHLVRENMFFICSITDDAHFYHFIKVVSEFSIVRLLSNFPFIVNWYFVKRNFETM